LARRVVCAGPDAIGLQNPLRGWLYLVYDGEVNRDIGGRNRSVVNIAVDVPQPSALDDGPVDGVARIDRHSCRVKITPRTASIPGGKTPIPEEPIELQNGLNYFGFSRILKRVEDEQDLLIA